MHLYPSLKGTYRRALLAAISLTVAIGLLSLLVRDQSAGQLRGTWLLVNGTVFGHHLKKEELGTRLTFKDNDEITWHFNTPNGDKEFEGVYHANASTHPKSIDLWEPAFARSGTKAMGIYKIDEGTLIIHMGARRPHSFANGAPIQLVLVRNENSHSDR